MPSDSANKPRRHDREFWEKNFQKKPNYQGRQKQASTTKVRGDPWQSLNAIQLGLEPRSFEKLHVERSYLLEMLQQHDYRARELFKRVPIVDEQWQTAETVDEQQRARKQRSWLRKLIGEIVEEEKNILARLSELHVEIQCQDRWHQVARDREMRNLGQQHAASYATFPPQPPVFLTTYYQVNAPPPYFYSHYPPYASHYPSYAYAEAPNTQGEYDGVFQPPWDPQNAPEDNYEPEAFEMDGTPINSVSDTKSRRYSTPLTPTLDSKPKKRTSMPSLNHTWEMEDAVLEDYHICTRSSSLH
ncbi:hypothetical protein F4821DRAFT_277426 [Hypoxylon rubiginosum]|uniref:Uncharacterized protein n=1 Tax=Hypoxylon rubiginosum TaxID=110542 RepID=A0ACC0D5B7_9PEZI|nr:hypothetical protein F4821DRAFT_277426 [Hypoxylon rubiginosum]